VLFKILMSLVFVAVFIIRIINPDIKIDTTSIILLVLAAVPWFIEKIKSFEINGVGKIELLNKEQKTELESKATEAGLLPASSRYKGDIQYTFYKLRYEDPKLALAGLRIEIENSLRKIAEKNSVDVPYGGIVKLIGVLSQRELISTNERSIIMEIIGILNRAVHGQLSEYDSNSFDWVFDLGLGILNSLVQMV
jgi:hypothetical protein